MVESQNLVRWERVVVLDGSNPRAGWSTLIEPSGFVVAADGGARHAIAEGVRVDLVVGDLDSLTSEELDALIRAGAGVERHPTTKDATDFELALERAVTLGSNTGTDKGLLIVGGAGGRIDHQVGNLAVLSGPRLDGVAITALMGNAVVQVARRDVPVTLVGHEGALVSLFPREGPAVVTTRGLEYSLDGATLREGSARGTSNVIIDAPGRIVVDAGVVLVIEPDAVPNLLQSTKEYP